MLQPRGDAVRGEGAAVGEKREVGEWGGGGRNLFSSGGCKRRRGGDLNGQPVGRRRKKGCAGQLESSARSSRPELGSGPRLKLLPFSLSVFATGLLELITLTHTCVH